MRSNRLILPLVISVCISTGKLNAYSLEDLRTNLNNGWLYVNSWFNSNVANPLRQWWEKSPQKANEATNNEATNDAAVEMLKKEETAKNERALAAHALIAKKQEELKEAIESFIDKLHDFELSISPDSWENATNVTFMEDLDSINTLGIPKMLYNKMAYMKGLGKSEDIFKAFEFLTSDIPWTSLLMKNREKLVDLKVSRETLKDLSTYLTRTKKFNWLPNKLAIDAAMDNAGKLLPQSVTRTAQSLRTTYIPLLRAYKIDCFRRKLKDHQPALVSLLRNLINNPPA